MRSFWINLFSSVAQSCPAFWDPMDCSTPGFPVHHQLLETVQTHVHWVGDDDTIQPSHPLSSVPFSCLQSFPAPGSFLMSQFFHIRWPKYWSVSFSLSPSIEYSGLISFWIDCFDLLEMAGWHHGLDGRESEWTPGDGDGQGGLVCCDFMGSQRVGHDWATELNWGIFNKYCIS